MKSSWLKVCVMVFCVVAMRDVSASHNRRPRTSHQNNYGPKTIAVDNQIPQSIMNMLQTGRDYINSLLPANVLPFLNSSSTALKPLVAQIPGSTFLGTSLTSIQSFATTFAATPWTSISDMGSDLMNQMQIAADSVAGVDIYQTGMIFSNLLMSSDVMKFTTDVATYGSSLFTSMITAPPQDVCYTGLGCFSMAYPWYSAMRPLPAPQSPTSIGVQFHLYSHANRARTVVRSDVPYAIRPADYEGTKLTFFIVHGKADDGNATWVTTMKEALLNRVDANVIVVDWGRGAEGVSHMQAASNTRVVGAVMITFANYLIQQKGATVKKMHFIGDGTGGHAAAYVGKAIPNIGRITGLDIDSTWFELYPDVIGLTSNDAVYVDVLHTSGLPNLLGGSGAVLPHGDKDFYINGGTLQPGCPNPMTLWPPTITLAYMVNSTAEVAASYSSCSHGRANQLFTASIVNSCMFVGRAKGSEGAVCTADTCSAMGFNSVLYPGIGAFNVAATPITPFCVRDTTPDAAMVALQAPQAG